MTTATIDSAATPQRARLSAPQAGCRAACSTRRCCWKSTAGRAAQARPAHAVAQPGHVHRRDRRRLDAPCWRSLTRRAFAWLIVVWLWLTVLFANLAEAVAEGRGKAQADALRRAKTDTMARRLVGWRPALPGAARRRSPAPLLQQGDIVVVEAGAGHPRRRRRRRRHRLASTSRPSPANPRR